jgi:diguanylate cyclase (GGDEF)-like protein
MFAQDNAIILIVDDNPTNLSILSLALKQAGYRVRVAPDGETALAQLQEEQPDLILLDIQMPGIDGFETCLKLKANPLTREIPVIFITASADVESKVRGLSVGAVDYIIKPFQHEEVLARVKVHLTLLFLNRKVQEQSIALQQANQTLHRLANLDGLTGVANRRRFDEYIDQEWRRLAREQGYLSLILCDIDYFKNYNDCYGHQAGDDCLKLVAQTISSVSQRPADLVARYGGEEFAIILPRTPPEGALHLAESIRRNVKELEIHHAASKIGSSVTLSLGIGSQIPSHELPSSILVSIADKALYAAKDQGRDRCHLMLRSN